ncbi:MAG: TPM domain-containing protein [Nitrospirae bacterium]|nr:TPM domain-containing protein [Nitrospirota bacterium]
MRSKNKLEASPQCKEILFLNSHTSYGLHLFLNTCIILFFFCSLSCLNAVTSFAEIVIPDKPYNHVVDLAGIINDDVEAKLNGYLLELEQKTTAQFIVLTINSLEGESLDDFSIKIAHEKWKLGQKGKDNGVLLLVSLQDRKYRFEVGYGLESILPDSLVGSMGREYLVPYFRDGDYSRGIYTAVLAVSNVIAVDAGVEITGMPKLRRQLPSGRVEFKKPSLLGSIFGILIFIGLIYMFIRHPRLLLFLFMMNMIGGGRRDGWGGGGGFGGGGGSFGGGGGGGFGGGGASGSW